MDEESKRGVKVDAKLTPDEKRRLEERAAADGMTVSDYLRKLILRDLASPTSKTGNL